MVTGAVVAAVVLAVAGVATAKIRSGVTLRGDFENLSKQSALQMSLYVDNTPQQVMAAAGGKINLADATSLAGSRLVVDVANPTGNDLGHLGPSTSTDYGVEARYEGTTPFTLRFTGGAVYGRLSLSGLAKAGVSARALQGFRNEANQLNRRVPGAAAFARGQWVEISAAEARRAEKLLETEEPESAPNLGPAAVARLRTAIDDALTDNVGFTDDGSVGGRHEYTITSHDGELVRQLAADPAVRSLFANDSFGGINPGNELKRLVNQVPAATTTSVQVFASAGRVQEVRVDLSQFGHSLTHPLYLAVGFADGSNVAAPHGAAALNLIPILKSELATGKQQLDDLFRPLTAAASRTR